MTTKSVALLLLLSFWTISFASAQEINQKKLDARGNEMLVGKIDKTGLTQNSYATWFNQQHENYEVDSKIIKSIKNELREHKITVFMGTWCGDSKREVPRFYKILEEVNFPMDQLTVVGVDYEKDRYKKSPGGEEKGLNIHKVPTFIFYKDGKEANRIVEHPVKSLEGDIADIVFTKAYTPSYPGAQKLIEILDRKGAEYLKSSNEAVEELKPIVSGEGDLNGYGYLLLYDKEFDKALAVFTLNTKLFPNRMNPFDSLAEAYELSGNKEKALENYKMALAVIENNPSVKRLKEKIAVLDDSR